MFVFPVLSPQQCEIAEILSHTFFIKNFVKAMVLLKKLLNSWFDEIFFSERELREFSLTHFGKNFVKVTVLLNKLLKSWFDEIFLVRGNFSFFHTVSVEITEIYSHHFLAKNFVKALDLLNKLLKSWFDEIFLVIENFSFFHSVTTVLPLLAKVCEINFDV